MRKANLEKLDALIGRLEHRARMRSDITDEEAAQLYARTLDDDYEHPPSPNDRYCITINMTDAEAAAVWQRSLEDW